TKFDGPLVPVIFWVSFADPGGYFLATRLQMRNDDILFMANAASVQATKFLNFVNLVAATAVGTEASVAGVPNVSAALHGHGLAGAPSKTFTTNCVAGALCSGTGSITQP